MANRGISPKKTEAARHPVERFPLVHSKHLTQDQSEEKGEHSENDSER